MRNLKGQLKQLAVLLALMALCFGNVMSLALAEDLQINAVADSVTVSKDINGREYVRIIVTEKRSLNGVSYEKSIPVMFFGEQLANKAKAIKAGQKFSAIVTPRDFRGRESYTAMSLL